MGQSGQPIHRQEVAVTTPPFKDIVTSEAELRALVGEPSERAVKKEIQTLDVHARAFIKGLARVRA